jgi:hypothetical protein
MVFRLFHTLFLIAPLKISFFLLLLTIVSGFYHSAVAESAQDSTIKAALALNFARFTEWPSSILKSSDPVIKLCVLGDSEVQQSFSEVDKKQVGDRVLAVINMTRLKNVEQCHLLYISALDRSKIIQLLAEINGRHILTISGDGQSFLADGGMVDLEIVEGKVNMQINLQAVSKAELTISSIVLKLATIVNP